MSRSPARGVRILVAAIVFLLPKATIQAQTSQAMLLGQVKDQATGQSIAKALVVARNLQTNSTSQTNTNDHGFYQFSALLPGTYSIGVDAPGFQPGERSPVELPVASRIELNFSLFSLPEAETNRSTTSSAAAPSPEPPACASANDFLCFMLSFMHGPDAAAPEALMSSLPVQLTETLFGSISALIDDLEIQELPLAGRDVYTLLVVQPGVTSDNATARGLGFSVNGQRVSSSNFLLDGVDNNDLLVTGPATLVSADAVKEYRMTTNNYTAEFGRSSGFIANAITRTGTNLLHGTLFEFFNQDRLNANSFTDNWQGLPRLPFHRSQFGGSVGGPVRRDRLFFFANFERFQTSSEGQPIQSYVPSAAFVSTLATGSLAQKLLTLFPPPNGQAVPGNPYVVIDQFSPPLEQRNTFAMGRLDYNSPSGGSRLSGRYAFSQQTSFDELVSDYPGLNAPLVSRGQNLAVNYIRDLLGGSNELKFGYNRSSVSILRPHPEIPSIESEDGVELPGSQAAYDYSVRSSVFDALDNFSRLFGKHSLVMGAEWRPGLDYSLVTPAKDGLYLFDSLSQFQLDDPSFLLISVDRQTGLPAGASDYQQSYYQADFAAFFQDNFKVSRRLTLNLGVRYEYFGVPAERNGTRDYNFVFGPGQDPGARIASGQLGQPGALYRPDRNNFAPRFGFALGLGESGKTALRGGYGIFYDRVFNNVWTDLSSNSLALQTLANFPGLPPQFQYTFPASNGVLPGAQISPASTVALDQGLRTPYAQNWFLGVQQQLSPNLVLEVDHAGSISHKLITVDTINRPYSVQPTASNASGLYNPGQPQITYLSNDGIANYLALETRLTRRWSKGVQFQASYTFSRTMDEQSDPFGRRTAQNQSASSALANSSFFQNANAFTQQFNPGADYGRSDFDQPHNLVFNVIAQAPQRQGRLRWLSGWQVSALAGFRAGFPFSVYTTALNIPQSGGLLIQNRANFTGTNLRQAFLQKPQPIPGGVVLLNPSVFSAPTNASIGNTARNAFRGPGFWNTDFSLSRSFPLRRLGEAGRLESRADFFNLFNHVNLNSPDTILESPTFGQATYGRVGFGSSLPVVSPLNEQPRQIQFSLKLYF